MRSGCSEGSDEFCIHTAGEDFQYRIDDVWRSHAQPVHETAFDAALRKEAGHLLAASVDHHNSIFRIGYRLGYFACQALAGIGRIKKSPAQFDQQFPWLHV